MFLVIPLTIALGALSGIGFIIYRKMPYIKKLSPEILPSGNFWREMAPELGGVITKDQLRGYKNTFLVDVEKTLRRVRILFLKFDAMSEAWIKRIRKSYKGSTVQGLEIADENKEVQREPAAKVDGRKKLSDIELKSAEQDLIIQIAKNPKDVKLYIALGETYMKMSNFEDAKEAFEMALKLDEENEKASSKLGKADEAIDKRDSA